MPALMAFAMISHTMLNTGYPFVLTGWIKLCFKSAGKNTLPTASIKISNGVIKRNSLDTSFWKWSLVIKFSSQKVTVCTIFFHLIILNFMYRRLRKRWRTRGALSFMWFLPSSFAALTLVFGKV